MVFPGPAAGGLGVHAGVYTLLPYKMKALRLMSIVYLTIFGNGRLDPPSRGQVEIAAGAIGTGWEILCHSV